MVNKHITRGVESAIEPIIDGGGAVITTGVKKYVEVPFHCYLEEVALEADRAGDIVIDIWKCAYDGFDAGSTHPVDGDSITASTPPTISAGTKVKDTTLTGWTREFDEGDILAFNVDSCATIQRLTIAMKVTRL